MQIKRQELESWYRDLGDAYALCCDPSRDRIRGHINAVWGDIGRMLATPDPVDMVPVQDYPFKLPQGVL